MRRRASSSLLVALLPALLLIAWPASSSASLSFALCAGTAPLGFSCASVSVPLDRRGQRARHDRAEASSAGSPAPRRATSAVVALAGGPGQAALGLGEFIAKAIAPALGTRDLLVFDQRGTGESDPAELRGARPARVRSKLAQPAGELDGPLRAAARARARRLHHAGIGRRHRGAPAGGRLRKARAVRHLLRHQGGAGVRRTLPPARGSAGARLGRAAGTARNRSRWRPSRRSAAY